MRENLLQFIWQYQYFNAGRLFTANGEPLRILSPGTLNTNQGPDFLDAAVRIGETTWSGHVELHILTSDWNRHAHQSDPNYRNVILHVVWENDRAAERAGGAASQMGLHRIPILELGSLVPKRLLGRYQEWMGSRAFIPCERQLPLVSDRVWPLYKHEMLRLRLHRQAQRIKGYLQENRQHWEETIWWLMARNFGLSVNGPAFESIARSIPVTILQRQRDRTDRLEALLLGQAGLLAEQPRDDYSRNLRDEYRYLQTRHELHPVYHPILFHRMRPGNFPALRLVQAAALRSKISSWLSILKETDTPGEMDKLLRVTAAAYWNDHTLPGVPAPFGARAIGASMRASLLINTFIPILYTFGELSRNSRLMDRALRWIQTIGPEKNARLTKWDQLGISCKNAADSQALLELNKHYCMAGKCLDCAVGTAILSI